jgi:hypothetical protein
VNKKVNAMSAKAPRWSRLRIPGFNVAYENKFRKITTDLHSLTALNGNAASSLHRRWNGITSRRLSYRRIDRCLKRRSPEEEFAAMKTIATLLAVAALSLAANTADAKGCIKGAVVGGVAGHYAGHHGMLGAAAGCLYGRHRANEQARQQQDQQGQPPAGQEKM